MEKMTLQRSTSDNMWARILASSRIRDSRIIDLTKRIQDLLRRIAPSTLFLVALYLLSFPHVRFGNQFLLSCVSWRFDNLANFFGKRDQGVRIIGAVLLCYAVAICPTGISPTLSSRNKTGLLSRLDPRNWNPRDLFTTAFSQYLGRISFGFYLMHGPVLFTIGTAMLVPAWEQWNVDHDTGLYMWRFLVATVVNLLCVFWAGDVFTRAVDERSVRWASNVAKYMSKHESV